MVATSRDSDERWVLRKECLLKKKRGMDRKFKEDMLEGMLLTKWPKFFALEVKLSSFGTNAELQEMKKMCPGEPKSLEKIKKMCQREAFHTPFWKGSTTDTDIPERPLSPAEVDVINRKYLELKATFDAMRARESTKDSVHRWAPCAHTPFGAKAPPQLFLIDYYNLYLLVQSYGGMSVFLRS